MSPLPLSLFAQTSGSTTTLVTTQLSQDDPSAFSTGGIMFFLVLAVILVGALVLYLRNRNPEARSRT